MELVSAAREYETREPEPSLADSSIACRCSRTSTRNREPRGARAADDAALGQGPRVPGRGDGRPRGGPVPALALRRGRGRARRGAPALLRRHHAGAHAARPDERGAPARVRRVPGHRAVTLPRGDSADLVEQEVSHAYSSPYAATRGGWDYAPNPYGRAISRPPARAREAAPFDVRARGSVGPRRPARRRPKVRHGQFGVGTVLSVEELDDDMKLVVQVRVGRHEDAAREVREAGTGVAVTSWPSELAKPPSPCQRDS